MKYTSCEKLLWFALSRPALRYIQTQKADWDISAYKRKVHQTYREIIARTPDIGTLRENSLRVCLTGGGVWLAMFEAADGQMDKALFARMVEKTMESPLLQASFKAKRKSAFTRKGQEKRKAAADKANPNHSPCNWNTEVRFGRDSNEYTLIYHQCGLCGLGRQEGLFHLVKYMCVLDYTSMALMGGTLFRTQTLAQGGACCDFYLCRKGCKWETERAAKGETLK